MIKNLQFKLITLTLVLINFKTLTTSANGLSDIAEPDSVVATKILEANVIAKKTSKKIDEVIDNYKDGREKYFKAVDSLYTIKRESYKELDKWTIQTLEQIDRKIIKDFDVEGERKQKELDIKNVFFSGVRSLYRRKAMLDEIRIFPSFTAYMSKLYYNEDGKKFSFFSQTNLNFGKDNGSFETEIVSGYLSLFRASLSTVLSRENTIKVDNSKLKGLTLAQIDSAVASVEDKNVQENTINKVISDGGELTFTMKAPFFNLWGNRSEHLHIKSDVVGKICADVPIAGNTVDEKDFNTFNSIGLENRIIIPLIDFKQEKGRVEGFETFSLFGRCDVKSVGGSSKFYNYLNIDKSRFWLVEYSGGLVFKNYMFYYSNQTFSADHLKPLNKGRFGVSLIKNF